MSQVSTRLYFIWPLLFIPSLSIKPPKIYLSSELSEDVNKEIFWMLAQFHSAVSSIQFFEDSAICSNDILTSNGIHSGKVLVILLKAKPECDFESDVPILRWYEQENCEDESNEEPEDLITPLCMGEISAKSNDLKIQVANALKHASDNQEMRKKTRQITQWSPFVWLCVSILLFLSLVLLSIILYCYFNRDSSTPPSTSSQNDDNQKKNSEKTAKCAIDDPLPPSTTSIRPKAWKSASTHTDFSSYSIRRNLPHTSTVSPSLSSSLSHQSKTVPPSVPPSIPLHLTPSTPPHNSTPSKSNPSKTVLIQSVVSTTTSSEKKNPIKESSAKSIPTSPFITKKETTK